jgi:putative nucleotidyltransferase with HDIG domain
VDGLPKSGKSVKPFDSPDVEAVSTRLRFLEESNSALIDIQDRLDRLSHFKSQGLLSHDVGDILETWLVRFRELVRIEVCSVFLVEEGGIEFIHAMSEPGELASRVQEEVDEQIAMGNFGRAIGSGIPLRVRTEIFGRDKGTPLSIMIAPLSNMERTIGAAVIIFEEDRDFIRQQTLRLLHILVDFFSLSLENAYLYADLKTTYFSTIRAIANSIEARDPYTKGHSERVAGIAKVMAEYLGWDKGRIDLIDWGGMLHDVGKIGVPDAILNKPGRLSDEEFLHIKEHPRIGAQIIEGISFLDAIVPYILDHHERFDGKGYVRGVEGREISVEGRLLAVADTFDAMTSDRPYRKALDETVALDEIVRNAKTQFDPEMVAVFESVWRSGKLNGLRKGNGEFAGPGDRQDAAAHP